MHPMMSCKFTTVRLPGLLALRSGHGRLSQMPPQPAVAIKKPAATSACFACASSRRDDAEEFSCNDDSDGRLVDEGMAILRRRIQEMEAAERGYGGESPQDQEWEKEWYDADVCQLLVVLQPFIKSRPGVALGLVAVLLLTAMSASAFLLMKLLLDVSRAIISNLHQ